MNGPDAIRHHDGAHLGRRVLLDGDRVRAARLSGDTRLEPWLKDLWERGAPLGAMRRYVLEPVGLSEIPAPRGRTVCHCFDVSEREIDAFLAGSNSLASLQARLKCGTNCGSCLPELRRKVRIVSREKRLEEANA